MREQDGGPDRSDRPFMADIAELLAEPPEERGSNGRPAFGGDVGWKMPSPPGGLGDVATGSRTLPKATQRERGQTSDFGALGAPGGASLQAAT